MSAALQLTDKFVNDLNAAAAIFTEISHKCLLFLHLEMRIECFHYLDQEGGEGEGGGAARLAASLLAFHDLARLAPRPQRLAYIMNGIGTVVWRWQSARGATATSAGLAGGAGERLAALRHCLAALRHCLAALRHCLATLRLPHDGLHAAHAYLHLLACTPEIIIGSVRARAVTESVLERWERITLSLQGVHKHS